jgi:hypothetical protein
LFRIQRRSRLNRRAMDRLVSEDLMVGMDQPDEAMPGLVPH